MYLLQRIFTSLEVFWSDKDPKPPEMKRSIRYAFVGKYHTLEKADEACESEVTRTNDIHRVVDEEDWHG